MTETGWEFGDVFAFHPDQLESWLSKIEAKFKKHDDVTERWLGFMIAGGAPQSEIDAMIDRLGTTNRVNNPKISRRYCLLYGELLPRDDLPAALAEFVRDKPLR